MNIAEYSKPLIFENMMARLSALKEKYPGCAEIFPLGKSVLSRTIPAVKFGSGSRSYLYIGAHHGCEWITSVVLLCFIEEMMDSLYKDTSEYGIKLADMLNSHSIYVIPMLNPDGVEYAINGINENNPLYERLRAQFSNSDFSRWQANARGIDLNHNYDAGFYEYKKIEGELGIYGPSPTRYGGCFPESEPEVKALCRLIRCDPTIKAVLTLHSQGKEIYYTSRGKCPLGAQRIARILSAFTSYSLSVPTGAAAYGGLTDWLIEELDIPSFTIECGLGKNPLPLNDYVQIYQDLRRVLFTLPYVL